ncbi:MAG TPA: hypothetical protein VMZ28_01310 [Kofleriaceae bacterium]|nr:hypothetical protein [Kofleriaceae bacterium]
MRLRLASVFLVMVCACGGDDDGGGDTPDGAPGGGLTLSATPGEFVVAPGDSVTLTLSVARDDVDGEVTITADDLPGDLEADAVTIAAGETEAEMTVTAPDDAGQARGTVSLTATDGAASDTAEVDATIRGAAGELDLTFGDGGEVSLSFGEPNTSIRGMALQPDGKLVVVGEVNGDWGIARFTADGALDEGFGDGGMIVQVFDTTQDAAGDVLVADDDTIIVTGHTSLGFTAVRYDADGVLDESYGEDGIASVGVDPAISWQILPRDDGGVILGGDSGTGDVLLVALTDAGVPDEDWGAGGAFTTDPGDDDQLYDMRYDAQGRILLAGRSGLANGVPFVCRVDGDGTPEEGGFNCGSLESTDTTRTGVAVAPVAGGKFVLLEATGAATLHRFLGTGETDDTLDGDGSLTYTPPGITSPSAANMAIDADGRVLVTGTASPGDATYHIYVMRLESSGSPDTGFGDEGITLTSGAVTEHQNGDAIEIAPDGRILVGGVSTGDDDGFFVARFWD